MQKIVSTCIHIITVDNIIGRRQLCHKDHFIGSAIFVLTRFLLRYFDFFDARRKVVACGKRGSWRSRFWQTKGRLRPRRQRLRIKAVTSAVLARIFGRYRRVRRRACFKRVASRGDKPGSEGQSRRSFAWNCGESRSISCIYP